MRGRTALYTLLALVAFAANSVLCRLALGGGAIDAVSFTTLRFVSGALTLLVILRARGGSARHRRGWTSALVLFCYALPFSFAYLSLAAGTGALILFGTVQATMIMAGLRSGERPHALEWTGLVAALGGIVYLVFPGLTAPSPLGSALMAVAGIGWGVYSLRGRGVESPLADTTYNFVRISPLLICVSLVSFRHVQATGEGVLYAVASGSLASGVGYVIWYAALRGLTATRAAIVQLSVPVIAALGGIAFLSEQVTLRLAVAAVLILGGVGVAVGSRARS